MFIPRIGQEVIVGFLEGNPDQPIIIGRVYNADEMPPYTLPDEQTKSTIKSNSSPGSGGFNEIRFEDKAGDEQLFPHAEKDMDVRVKNDSREWIGEDRSLIVKRDRMEQISRDTHLNVSRDEVIQIGRDRHESITGKEAIKIGGSKSEAVTGDVIEQFQGNHSSQATQNLYLKAMQIVIEAQMGLTLKMGSDSITLVPSGITILGTPMVMINSGGSALSGSPGSLVSPISPANAAVADDAVAGSMGQPQGLSASIPQVPLAAVKIDGPTHDPNSDDNKDKTHWIEIVLLDEAGNPVPGEPYQINFCPDGTTIADGTLDNKGFARVDRHRPRHLQGHFPESG